MKMVLLRILVMPIQANDDSYKRQIASKIKKNFSHLFSNGMWKTTLMLVLLWMGTGWLYYGIVMSTTSLVQYNPILNMSTEMLTNESTYNFSNLLTSDYLKILAVSAAEIPGVVLTVVLIEVLGRKITMAVEFIGCMVGFLLLFICASDTLLTFFLFIIRAFATGSFVVGYTYVPETYPMDAWVIGMGVCISAARVGAMLAPYAALVLLRLNYYATISLYASSSLGLAIVAILLPKGRTQCGIRNR